MSGFARIASFRVCALALLLAVPALAFGPAPAVGQPAAGSPHPMFIENASPANLPRTVTVFLEEARAAGWSHLGTHNMAGILSAAGHTLHPVLIVEVCSGRFTAQLLGRDETRFVASMIPCRVAIYQTSGGQVIISRTNSGMMAGMLPPAIAEVIVAAGTEVEAIIARTLARLP